MYLKLKIKNSDRVEIRNEEKRKKRKSGGAPWVFLAFIGGQEHIWIPHGKKKKERKKEKLKRI